jgi:hypothetical protein
MLLLKRSYNIDNLSKLEILKESEFVINIDDEKEKGKDLGNKK